VSLIIGISGKAQHGKDTTCEFIREILESGPAYLHVVRVSFADELKDECRREHGWNGVKDEAGRSLLQRVGVERRAEDVNYWVNKAFARMTDKNAVYVVPDCRFRNEADAIKARGGVVWRIVRSTDDGVPFDNGLTPEQKAHSSETDLDGYDFDTVISNYSLPHLRLLVRSALLMMGLL
jgi:hypothetical protein